MGIIVSSILADVLSVRRLTDCKFATRVHYGRRIQSSFRVKYVREKYRNFYPTERGIGSHFGLFLALADRRGRSDGLGRCVSGRGVARMECCEFKCELQTGSGCASAATLYIPVGISLSVGLVRRTPLKTRARCEVGMDTAITCTGRKICCVDSHFSRGRRFCMGSILW
jgi:hypothetical protein